MERGKERCSLWVNMEVSSETVETVGLRPKRPRTNEMEIAACMNSQALKTGKTRKVSGF